MRFRAKLTIAMVLLLSLTYGIGGSLMIAQSFSSSIARERDTAVQTYRMVVDVLDLLGERWAYDLGADNYNLQNELKYPEYSIYRKRSEGHNVLVFNPQNYSKSVEMKLNQFAPIIDAQGNEYG